ncbi:precorrin-8X methylmutase [Magnetococcus marinus MC-1]|uniref:Precorrin-8X methylmutase n=1 Tax=Magnetococcus marinus (strain ATCC BAA-1437 / JCM 17883 / MC-1) TaxID=156889 RepID=A0LCD1_MAGMM|nr:precorrin-8X methylmutase [Magnetococcus marinus]ABK45624.1 precorrin-8X methylmutase [Magnetococcus marinus MC-1]
MTIAITEQDTRAGRQIEHNSFAIVDAEAGPHPYSEAQWQVVRRMIHATADFEFNGLTRFHDDAMQAGMDAVKAGAAILSDVEMIRVGLSQARLAHFGMSCHQFINDDDVAAKAKQEDTTRAVQAMRKARDRGLMQGAIVGIGNAPTALLEVIRQVQAGESQPALIIGMPVGFVSAAESKAALQGLQQVPWIVTHGRKGGSTMVVAAIHALLSLCAQP